MSEMFSFNQSQSKQKNVYLVAFSTEQENNKKYKDKENNKRYKKKSSTLLREKWGL